MSEHDERSDELANEELTKEKRRDALIRAEIRSRLWDQEVSRSRERQQRLFDTAKPVVSCRCVLPGHSSSRGTGRGRIIFAVYDSPARDAVIELGDLPLRLSTPPVHDYPTWQEYREETDEDANYRLTTFRVKGFTNPYVAPLEWFLQANHGLHMQCRTHGEEDLPRAEIERKMQEYERRHRRATIPIHPRPRTSM